MKNNPFNQKLALLAFTLAFLAMIASFIIPDGLYSIKQKPSYIPVLDLAEKIMNREKLHLIDLRSEEEYLKFHIPTAQNRAFEEYLSNTTKYKDTIVFYSGDDTLTRQLWNVLPDTLKPKIKILYGGVHDWYERLLYPKLPGTFSTKDSVTMERIKKLNKFYGGRMEFVEDHDLLHYYHKDMTKVLWANPKRTHHGLVRKGC